MKFLIDWFLFSHHLSYTQSLDVAGRKCLLITRNGRRDSGVRPRQIAKFDLHTGKKHCDRKLSFIEDFEYEMARLISTLSIYFIFSDRRSRLSQSRRRIYDAVIV